MVEINPSDSIQDRTINNPTDSKSAEQKPTEIFNFSGSESAQPARTAKQVRTADMSSKEIGVELVSALNSRDRDMIDALLSKINEDNASTVYREYFLEAENIGEYAGGGFKIFGLSIPNIFKPRGSSRTETLIQGIINNKDLTKSEKIKYINETLDKMYDHAQKYRDFYHTTDAQLNDFQDGRDKAVEYAVEYSHNASVLETNIRRIYNW